MTNFSYWGNCPSRNIAHAYIAILNSNRTIRLATGVKGVAHSRDSNTPKRQNREVLKALQGSYSG
jgi:hypothetical protein